MSQTKEINSSEFEEFISQNTNIVVDCWAPWCGPCKMIAPIVDELATQYDGKIAFGKLNIDDNQAIAMKYGVMSIPTLLVFKDGEVIDRLVGAMPKKNIEEKLNSLF